MSKQFLGELKWVAPGESGQQRLEDFLGASYRGQQPGLPNVVPGYELTPSSSSQKSVMFSLRVVVNRRFLVVDAKLPKEKALQWAKTYVDYFKSVDANAPNQGAEVPVQGQAQKIKLVPGQHLDVTVSTPSGTVVTQWSHTMWASTAKKSSGSGVPLVMGVGGTMQKTPQQRLVDFIENEAKIPSSTRFLGGVKWLGATPCEDMENALQALLMKKSNLEKALEDIQAALPKVKAAWDYCYGQRVQGYCASLTGQALQDCLNAAVAYCNATNNYESVKQQEAGIKADLQSLEGQIVELEAKIKNCPSGGGGGGSGCQAGYEKDASGKCVPVGPTGCKTAADCPPGQVCVNGLCQPAPKSTGTSSSGLGLLVLGSAALGLAFFASKSELAAIPKHPSQKLQANKSRRRRRR